VNLQSSPWASGGPDLHGHCSALLQGSTIIALCVHAYLCFLPASFAVLAGQKDEVLNEETHQSFQNAVAVMPLFARSVAAELREASDQVGRH